MVACLQDHSNDLLAHLSSSYTICLDDFPLTAGEQAMSPEAFKASYTNPISPHSLHSPGAFSLTPTALLA